MTKMAAMSIYACNLKKPSFLSEQIDRMPETWYVASMACSPNYNDKINDESGLT